MLKRSIAVIVACALLVQVCGCTTMQIIPRDSIDGTIYGHLVIETYGGKIIHSGTRSSQVESDTLYVTVKGDLEKIPLSEIRVLYRMHSEGITGVKSKLGLIVAFTGIVILFFVFMDSWR